MIDLVHEFDLLSKNPAAIATLKEAKERNQRKIMKECFFIISKPHQSADQMELHEDIATFHCARIEAMFAAAQDPQSLKRKAEESPLDDSTRQKIAAKREVTMMSHVRALS